VTSTGHDAPKDPQDWIAIADRELGNLRGAYVGKLSHDAKIDHALMATEAVLKAILWKQMRWNSWPPPKGFGYMLKHDLQRMLDATGLSVILQTSPEHFASWQVLLNAAVKRFRYSPNAPSEAEANEVSKCARFPDTGIVPWLKSHYETMR
jgi:hypothetical protein